MCIWEQKPIHHSKWKYKLKLNRLTSHESVIASEYYLSVPSLESLFTTVSEMIKKLWVLFTAKKKSKAC